MCDAAAHILFDSGKQQQAATYFQRARDVGAAHGFFSLECRACLGLGTGAFLEGRVEEGVQLLWNALSASSLREVEDEAEMELQVLARLTDVLFRTHAIDEMEPLVLRFREVARAKSRRDGRVCYWELSSLYACARLDEVLNPFTPRRPCLHQGRQRLSQVPARPSEDTCSR